MTTATQARTAAVMITGAELRKSVNWARPGPAPAMAVLAGIRVTVTGNRLVLTSFDYETIRTCTLTLTAAGDPGQASVLVPGETLNGMIKALPSGRTPIEVAVAGGDQVDLTAQPGTVHAARMTVAGFADTSQYPAIPLLPPPVGTLPGDGFRAAAARVLPMASTDGTLPLIGCLHLAAGAQWLSVEATDRYRIGVDQVPWASPVQSRAGWNLPAPVAAAFVKASAGGRVFLFGDAERVGLTDGQWTVITRQVTGDWFNVRRYMAARPPFTATLTADAAALHAKVSTAAGRAPVTDAGRLVELAAVAGKPLRVSVHGVAGSYDNVDAVTDGAAKLTAVFNGAFLTSMVSQVTGPVVIHCLVGDGGRVGKPVKVTAASAPDWTGMVVPIVDAK